MNRTEALKAIDELEKLVQSFGGPYEQEHRAFKALVFSLRNGSLHDHYFREKLSDAENWASDGFSSRKFNNYLGGLQHVKVRALGALSTARSLIQQSWPER